jgi:flotillin
MGAEPIVIAGAVLVTVMVLASIFSQFLTTVPAGVIRLVSYYRGEVPRIYKGPGKAIEIPLLTTGASIPSQAINIDLDITDQTSDRDANGIPSPIKVNVLASAIVAVGDTDEMILTASNRFFSKSSDEQQGTLTDLLTSAGRRAINLLQHDQLFSSQASLKVPVATSSTALVNTSQALTADPDDDEDPLAVIIKRQCSRELHDLGLTFKSLNIKLVNSEVAEARRRQTAMEAKANADIVQYEQERRAQEAKLAAAQIISDKERELDRRKAENAAQVAQAEALKQEALAVQRTAELKATQIAQASADAERVRVKAQGDAEAERVRLVTTAQGEAERTRLLANAQAEAIHKINVAIREGGDAYLKLKQLELIPQVVPEIAKALAAAKLINISGNGDAASGATSQITAVLQTVLAANLLKDGLLNNNEMAPNSSPAVLTPPPPPPSQEVMVTPPPAPPAPQSPPSPRIRRA